MPPPTIKGDLPFGSLAAAGQAMAPLAGSPQQAAAALPGAYKAAYGSALDFNTANYQNIFSGYEANRSSQADALDSIGRGYSDLSSRVLSGLEGAGAGERAAIQDRTAGQLGAAGQSLVSRGLGNSTVVDSTNRGIYADQNKAYLDLADRLMQQRAGYTSQLGLAGLGQQQQAALANSGLAQNELGWMNSVNAPYPNAQLFAGLAQQYGQSAETDRRFGGGGQTMTPGAQPQSAGAVSRGGGGFFTQPADFSSSGTYSPQSFAPTHQPQRPPLGAVTSQAQGDAAQAYFNAGGAQSGMPHYTPPAGQGFAGGTGGGTAGGAVGGAGYDMAGEDYPYGGAAPTASYGAWSSPYGNPAAGGYDPSAAYNPYSDLGADASYFGYGGG